VKPESDHNINISNLEWWVKYYVCDSVNQPQITISTWSYNWNNLIVVKNCKIFIKWNIYKSDEKSSLTIFSYTDEIKNLNSIDYLSNNSNVYISDDVSDIEAWILTNGSIFTIKWNILDLNNLENILISIKNNKQLYINWTIVSKNNIWGSFFTDWYIVVWSSKRLQKDVVLSEWFWWRNTIVWIRNLAHIFDLNFMREYKYIWENNPDPSWYSNYCSNINKADPWCSYSVYIKYDPSIRNNILFKN